MTLALANEPLPLATDPDGVVRVSGTRVTLDTVVASFRQGATAEEIVQQYPTLPLGDVYAVLGFLLRRETDVDQYLRARGADAEAVRLENERRFPPAGIRERLRLRRRSAS
jgi:uncharacterized protein (DUF433 family)